MSDLPQSGFVQTDVLEKTRTALSSCLGIDSADINDTSALGVTRNWDSLKHMEVVLLMEEKFGIIPTPHRVVEMMSFKGICNSVLSHCISGRQELNLSKSDFIKALRETGLSSGDNVFVQSSIGTFGMIDNPLETIKAAFMEVIGEKGTLAVPAFNFGFLRGMDFDIDNSASETGLFSEFIRTRPDAVRSQHPPFHSVAAIGKHARDLSDVCSRSSFARDSVFGKMVDLDFKICMFGTTLMHNTYFHYIEEQVGVPYRFYKTFSSIVNIKGKTQRRSYEYYARFSEPVVRSDFHTAGEALKDHFDCKSTFVGLGPIYLFRAKAFVDVCSKLLAKFPDLFVVEEDKPKLQEILRGEYRR